MSFRLSSLGPALALLSALLAFPAGATWSIAAVDRATSRVGIAGASCTFNVQGIGEVVPGRGAVIVQAMSNDDAREHGLRRLRLGAAPGEVVAAMRDGRFDPENQQYAVVVLDRGTAPATYSGESISAWRGAIVGASVAVQGNTLVGEKVLTDALAAYRSARAKSLAERLLAALVAGAEAGGDKRCGPQRARSAFVTVYNPDDDARTPYFHLVVYGLEKGGAAAVEILRAEFAQQHAHGRDRKSSRQYVIP